MRRVLIITNGFDRMSDENLLVKANQIRAAMTANPAFTDPSPSLVTLEEAIEVFSTALDACRDGDRQKAAVKNQKKEQLVEVLHLLADFVVFKSEGDIVTATSSGFSVRKAAAPREPITAAQNVRLLQGPNSGELIGKASRVAGATSYVHQYATEAEMAQGKWNSMPSSRVTVRITNLQPGTLYYYRVAAVGPKDQLVYSVVISRIAA
jgi:hypothetical protein